jgi:hypothetical protein
MEHFTQLNLQSKSQDKRTESAKSAPAHYLDRNQQTAAFFGMLAATVLVGGFLFETACSSSDNKPTHSAIAAPSVTAAMPAAQTPVTPAAVTEKPKPKNPRQHPLATSTYKNAEYGVSFRYPKKYVLLEGDSATKQWNGLTPMGINFAQPGGEMLSAVAMPKSSYPASNLAGALFSVSVHPKLSADECAKFQDPGAANADPAVKTKMTKAGAANVAEVEYSSEDGPDQAKFYHVYQNGACYEFGMGTQFAENKITDRPVNPNEVFRKLNWMLSTVKIEKAGTPEKTVAKDAGTANVPESKN